MTTFLVLRITHDLSGCPESGDTRRAAHSSVRLDLGAGSSCLRRFARPRYRSDRDTPTRIRVAPSSREMSADRRARVSGPSEGRVLEHGGACWASTTAECVRLAHADDVPLLISSRGHLLSPVRPPARERAPHQTIRTDQDPRSSVNPRRLPAPRGSGCLPPLRPGT